jgi:hypothetical protein
MTVCGKDFDSLRNSVSRAKFGFDYVKRKSEDFSGMRLASIVDDIPNDVRKRDGASMFLDEMEQWPICFGTCNYSIKKFRGFGSIDDIFEGRNAS